MKETLINSTSLEFSDDLKFLINNLEMLEVTPDVPQKLNPLFKHVTQKIEETLEKLISRSSEIKVCGPDWCRANPELAGESHAKVIVATYGPTYALPNKDPEVNRKALVEGSLDMYLIFENGNPVGTACMVINPDGWGELGRSASLGGIGNRLIQDLRIVRWLTNPVLSEKVFGIFSTLRTAPDRNIGTDDDPEIMRGGQAVTRIWSRMPEVMIGGLGPLYKKHGALEQFAYAVIVKKDIYIPKKVWILGRENSDFVSDWVDYYRVDEMDLGNQEPDSGKAQFGVHYPPLETGLTHLIHGEITVGHGGEEIFDGLVQAIGKLEEVRVPFIQVLVRIDKDTLALQRELQEKGFQAFLFTPGIVGKQPPLLWFGRVTQGISVVPTFWNIEKAANPFWNKRLATFADDVATRWRTSS